MRRPFEQPAAHHARLARRAAAGDRAAFVELYRTLYPPVARFVARRVPARADAEDVVARTFHRLLEALPALDGARGTVLGYALTVARHAATDLRRAGAGGAGGEAGPEPADGAPHALANLGRVAVVDAAPDAGVVHFRHVVSDALEAPRHAGRCRARHADR